MNHIEKATRARPNNTVPPTRAEYLEASAAGREMTGELLAEMRAKKEQQRSKPPLATVETTAKTLAALETTVAGINERLKRIEAEMYRHKLTGLLR